MQVVASFDVSGLPVAIDLAPPHVFLALRDGTLLRFRAEGASTRLLSRHTTLGEPVALVVASDGRTVLLVKRERDELDVFEC